MIKEENDRKRICLIDEIRGFSVLMMVLFHAYYVMGEFFGISFGEKLYNFFLPLEPVFAAVFIILCGVSCTLSRSNLRRGLKALAAALAFTLVTAVILPGFNIRGAEVYFGILHFLACSILIYALIHKLTDRIPPFAGIIICILLFLFFLNIEKHKLGLGALSFSLPENLYQTNYFIPFGIYNSDFYSADYFPLFPFVFVFFAGVYAGNFFRKAGFPARSYKMRVPFLDYIGRHAFIIYVLHIPLTALAVFGVVSIIKLFR